MTDLCLHLDDYVDGRLSDAETDRFEAHLSDCAACEAALAFPDDLSAAFSDLGAVPCPPGLVDRALAEAEGAWPETWERALRGLAAEPCPPEIVEAALRRARHAPDRAPHRLRRVRWVGAAVALAACVTVAFGWVRGLAVEPAVEPIAQVRQVDARSLPDAAPPDPAPREAPAERDASAERAAPADPESAGASSAVASTVPPAAQAPPTPQPAPQPAPASATQPLVADAGDATQPDAPTPSPDDIAEAQRDLALAFGLVADAQSRAGQRVRDEAGALSSTLDHTLPF